WSLSLAADYRGQSAGGGGRLRPTGRDISTSAVRTSFLHIPGSLAENASAPLVLVSHGGGGHAANMPHFTHFDELADRKGLLVAYPESFNKSWNDTHGLSPADDVGFIR